MGLNYPQEANNQEGGAQMQSPPPQQQVLPQLPPQPQAIHWDFYQRLSMLREAARKQAARATTLTNIAAALTVGISTLNLIWVLFMTSMTVSMTQTSTVQVSTSSQSGDQDFFSLIAIFTIFGLLLFATAVIFGVSVLGKASKLYTHSYQESSRLFNSTGLALVFVQEDYWNNLQNQLAERSWIKFVGRSTYHSLEEHLDWCACHFPSLRNLADNNGEPSIWQLRLEEAVYKNRKWFMQDTWVYWTCGCLSFIAMRIGFIILLMYTLQGGRYINSRGVLVALCDFMLQAGAVEDAPLQQSSVHDTPKNY